MIKTTNADSADFPPAGGVWGGMRAGFGLGVLNFKNSRPTIKKLEVLENERCFSK